MLSYHEGGIGMTLNACDSVLPTCKNNVYLTFFFLVTHIQTKEELVVVEDVLVVL